MSAAEECCIAHINATMLNDLHLWSLMNWRAQQAPLALLHVQQPNAPTLMYACMTHFRLAPLHCVRNRQEHLFSWWCQTQCDDQLHMHCCMHSSCQNRLVPYRCITFSSTFGQIHGLLSALQVLSLFAVFRCYIDSNSHMQEQTAPMNYILGHCKAGYVLSHGQQWQDLTLFLYKHTFIITAQWYCYTKASSHSIHGHAMHAQQSLPCNASNTQTWLTY